MMIEQVKVQEFVFVLATKGQNPSVLNADFLRYSGIVTEEMELAKEPIYTNQLIQISYTNGLVMTAQPNRIVFSELLQDKTPDAMTAPAIARKLVETLPKLAYQAVGINPRGYIPVEPEVATQFVSRHLLAQGAWQKFGNKPMKASVNYSYSLEQGQLNLSVSEASLQLPDKETMPVVLFSGNIDHILDEYEENKLGILIEFIDGWQQDLNLYTELVNTYFLDSIRQADMTKGTFNLELCEPEPVVA
ncbi:MAG: hypothetical protein F6K30_10260 [Cyanothece sp. SIO2G6]|nr:hypothetical protein [Cyanothece sp. SIO2G6]